MEPEIMQPTGDRAIAAFNALLEGFNVLAAATATLEDSLDDEGEWAWLFQSDTGANALAGGRGVVEQMQVHLERCSSALDELQPFMDLGGEPSAELVERAERLAAACYRIAGVTAPVVEAVRGAQPAEVIAAAVTKSAGEIGTVGAGVGAGLLVLGALWLLAQLR